MWATLVENSGTIRSIFKEHSPNLENIILHEFKIIMGSDLVVSIRFDLAEIPAELPEKWMIKEVNTIQISLDFNQVEIEYFDLKKDDYNSGKIIIEEEGSIKKIIYRNINNRLVFTIKSKWIYVQSITGYKNENID